MEKETTSRRIAFYESLILTERETYLLAHARQEWAQGHYGTANHDLDRLSEMLEDDNKS